MELQNSDFKSPAIEIREQSALEFGENILEKGVDSSFFDIILASHWLRYSHRHPNDPVKEFHQLFEQAVQKFYKGPQEPVDIKALHAWVRYNFDFKASSKSSPEMLKEKTNRCATATDLILSILEKLGLENLHAIYFFDHKQAAYKEADGSFIVMDPYDPHPVRRDEKEARGVVLDFEDVKKRKLAVLDRLIKKEKGQPEAKESSPQVIEKMSRFFKEGVYKTLFRALSTSLLPDSIDENGPPCKDSHGSYLSLLTMAISHLVSIPPPKRGENKKSYLGPALVYLALLSAVRIAGSGYDAQARATGDDDLFIERVEMLCEPTKKPTSFTVVDLDPSSMMSFPAAQIETIHENPWNKFTEQTKLIINNDFFQVTRLVILPDPDLTLDGNTNLELIASESKELVEMFLFYKVNTPYMVYRVNDSSSKRLNLDEVMVQGNTVFKKNCLPRRPRQ
jgi:hypothetical protein